MDRRRTRPEYPENVLTAGRAYRLYVGDLRGRIWVLGYFYHSDSVLHGYGLLYPDWASCLAASVLACRLSGLWDQYHFPVTDSGKRRDEYGPIANQRVDPAIYQLWRFITYCLCSDDQFDSEN